MKPCQDRHPEPLPGKCHACRLFTYSKAHNLLWGGDGNVLEPTPEVWAKIKNYVPHDPGPGILRRGFNFAVAAVRHLAGGCKGADQEERDRRMKVCQGCPLYVEGFCRHQACGCALSVKVAWLEQRCPMGKW